MNCSSYRSLLAKKSVGIAGLGGLGSSVAVSLARSGIGSLVLADFDVVELSNLYRQHYFEEQVGQLKVKAIEQNLRRISLKIAICSHAVRLDQSNIPEIFADTDVIIEALDDPEEKAMFVTCCLASFPETPIIAASGIAGLGSGNKITIKKVGDRIYLVGDDVTAQDSHNLLWPARVGIAANHQAHIAVRILLGLES